MLEIKKNVTVSVCMITYNHGKYISQAIENVISQDTEFPFELIIGEDLSTDNTRSICRKYAEEYPDKINLLSSHKNLGVMNNFMRTLKACSGKYVALCEGDDYWCDPLKLQRQVDFLESNNDFVICYHPVAVLKNNKLQKDTATRDAPETCNIAHLAHGNIMHTCSVVFRAGLFDKFPASFYTSPVGDYFLHMLNARYGLIKRLPQVMAVYRIHEGGIWSSEKNMDLKILDYLEGMIGCFEPEINEILIKRHKSISYRSFCDRIDEPGFEERFGRCQKYGGNEFRKNLSSIIKWDRKYQGSALLNLFRKIISKILI